jgi:hypothetical protein
MAASKTVSLSTPAKTLTTDKKHQNKITNKESTCKKSTIQKLLFLIKHHLLAKSIPFKVTTFGPAESEEAEMKTNFPIEEKPRSINPTESMITENSADNSNEISSTHGKVVSTSTSKQLSRSPHISNPYFSSFILVLMVSFYLQRP